MTAKIEWDDASTSTYTATSTTIGDLTVIICEDDEGPMRPAYYWDIMREGVRIYDGWCSSVRQAKAVAVDTARLIMKGKIECQPLRNQPR